MGGGGRGGGSGVFYNCVGEAVGKARRNGSKVRAMKTSPPAVAMGPPRLIEPGGVGGCLPPKSCIEPSGTCQRIFSSIISTTDNMPQGGAMQGMSDGDCRNRRNMP